jgi:hypothetical protein
LALVYIPTNPELATYTPPDGASGLAVWICGSSENQQRDLGYSGVVAMQTREPNTDGEGKSRSTRARERPSSALRCGGPPCQFRLTRRGCQPKLTAVDVEELSVNLSSDDPAIGLRASLALHRLAERVEANQVAAAREKGWSWQQIGDALGVTRQSVHTKYNKESS